MELTKKDRKHINDEVSRLTFRISVESQEYARLYEREYLSALIAKLQSRKDAIDALAEAFIRTSEPKQ